VGNQAFATWYQNLIANNWRVTNRRDMVPHVPPIPLTSYWHNTREVFYRAGGTGTFVTCDGSGEDRTCSNSMLDVSISDHLTYLGGNCCCAALKEGNATDAWTASDEMELTSSDAAPEADAAEPGL